MYVYDIPQFASCIVGGHRDTAVLLESAACPVLESEHHVADSTTLYVPIREHHHVYIISLSGQL